MIEVESAIEKIRQVLSQQKKVESISILEATGRVCAEDVLAELAVPNFVRACMDGYAVRSAEIQEASPENPVSLKVIATIYAGDGLTDYLQETGVAVRIMTGAPIPENFDAVIKQEWTDYGEKEVKIYQAVEKGKNCGEIGEDIALNQTVVSKYQYLNSYAVGALATQGIQLIKVFAPLKVGLLTTGNELASLGTVLKPGEIYESNLYTLVSFIQSSGGLVVFKGQCSDDVSLIAETVYQQIDDVDLFITTGGVSVGEKDCVPEAIGKLGGKCLFHFVHMKPGTPVMASLYHNRIILSLSGNPFASIVNFHLFYWAILAYFMNCPELNLKSRQVELADDLMGSAMRRFIRAYEENGVVSLTSGKQQASVFHNTIQTNCLIDLPAKKNLKKGDCVTIHYWKE